MKSLILLRGLPGSGKTTLAHVLSENGQYPVYSVDDYFTHPETGEYQFRYKENYLAYRHCEESCRASMIKGEKKIFIHNVFSIEWEMEPYFKLASEHEYQLHIVTVENYHDQQNTHAISDEQIKKMAEKFKIKLH